jgi:hypothetical protein
MSRRPDSEVSTSIARHSRHPLSRRDPLAQPASDPQSFAPVEPVDALVIDLVALTPKQHVEAAVPVSRTLSGQGKQSLSKLADHLRREV